MAHDYRVEFKAEHFVYPETHVRHPVDHFSHPVFGHIGGGDAVTGAQEHNHHGAHHDAALQFDLGDADSFSGPGLVEHLTNENVLNPRFPDWHCVFI